jgi:hypothetical protein
MIKKGQVCTIEDHKINIENGNCCDYRFAPTGKKTAYQGTVRNGKQDKTNECEKDDEIALLEALAISLSLSQSLSQDRFNEISKELGEISALAKQNPDPEVQQIFKTIEKTDRADRYFEFQQKQVSLQNDDFEPHVEAASKNNNTDLFANLVSQENIKSWTQAQAPAVAPALAPVAAPLAPVAAPAPAAAPIAAPIPASLASRGVYVDLFDTSSQINPFQHFNIVPNNKYHYPSFMNKPPRDIVKTIKNTNVKYFDLNEDENVRYRMTIYYQYEFIKLFNNNKKYKKYYNKILNKKIGYEITYNLLKLYIKKYKTNWYDLPHESANIIKFILSTDII